MTFPANWYAGWTMILVGFAAGAVLGLRFHRAEFLGGYASWERRLLRLGHVALVALGLLNVVYAGSPVSGGNLKLAGALLIAGGLAMPTVCVLAAWRNAFRNLFFFPVATLLAAVCLILTS